MPTSFSDAPVRRRPRRVLVVDDSELMRSWLIECIRDAGDYEIAGEAGTGYQAIGRVHELNPDIVTLDLEMPDLSGLDALGYIMSEAPRPIIIVSSHTAAMADPALSAMVHGAVEFVAKPVTRDRDEVERFRTRLAQALQAATIARLLNITERIALSQRRRYAAHDKPHTGQRHARCAVVIAASTGGPSALTEFVPRLEAGTEAAVIIVQHMPPLFTAALAKRLNEMCDAEVTEAVDGEPVEAGRVYLAPGGLHLELVRTGNVSTFHLSDAAPVWGVRPAADILFGSAARTFGPATVGVVLTGMGRDGASGLRAIRDVGGATLVQDEATCVIPSMPRAAAEYATAALPLPELAGEVMESVARQLRPRAS